MIKEDYREFVLKTVDALNDYCIKPSKMFDLGWDGYMAFPKIVENYHVDKYNFMLAKWQYSGTCVLEVVPDSMEDAYLNWVKYTNSSFKDRIKMDANMIKTLDEIWGIEFPIEDYDIIINTLQELNY